MIPTKNVQFLRGFSLNALSLSFIGGVSLLVFAAPAFAQRATFYGQNVTSAASATPVFVNDTSWSSNGTSGSYAVATRVAGTVTCVNFATCIRLGDGTLTGNLEIFAGMSSGSGTPTALDTNESGTTVNSSYTCANGGTAVGSTYPWICYKPNVTSGAVVGQITFGASGTFTNVLARSHQVYNIATSSPVDAIQECHGTTTTSPSCSAITTTQANDYIYAIFCPISVPTTTFTVGAGFSYQPTDQQAACDVETEIDASTGSFTASATFGTSSTFVGYVVAFKSATAGTAPSGKYIARMMSYNTPAGGATVNNFTVKFPSLNTGDLLVETNSCNVVQITGVTDGTNTWTTTSNHALSANNNNASYVINSTANATGSMTVTTNAGTGDCTFKFYDIVNAGTSLSAIESTLDTGAGLTGSVYYVGVNTSTEWSLDLPTSGLSFFTGGQGLNTMLYMNGPSSMLGDASTQGGENIDGPWQDDQNNPFFHTYTSGSAITALLSLAETSSSGAHWAGMSGDMVSFYPSGATLPIGSFHSTPISSGTDNNLTGLSIPSGSMIMVAVNTFHSISPARTTTNVCYNGNSTCGTGTALTQCSACTTTGNTAVGATSIWYATAVSGTVTRIDAIFNATVSDAEFRVVVFNAPSAWSIDGNQKVQGGTGSGSLNTGPSITTTGVVDACTAIIVPASGTSDIPSNAAYIYGGFIQSPQGTSWVDGLFTSTGTYVPTWTDSSSGDSFNSSAVCLKHS